MAKNIFISYVHKMNEIDKNKLSNILKLLEYNDCSVKKGEIKEKINDKKIFKEIKINYLSKADITIVLLDQHTMHRKHVDWEIKHSLKLLKKEKLEKIIFLFLKDYSNNNLFSEENCGKRISRIFNNNLASFDYFDNVIKDNKLIDILIKYSFNQNSKNFKGVMYKKLKQNLDCKICEKIN
ncbi:TIR domain-containing protein [Mesoplasma florum]|uniref:TIR domain-containing protein n=1 Tax=Mesoplasma florum TaxID=2151 RepID=UPI000BE2B668|nr:TIR domain-containing protein [Mesoplasma florum]ATI73287.1 hypothetical protein CQZ69_01760 [Mesoplasma florum]AVN61689.1 hypothetical protein CG004_01760 [Mesoplasma florum]